ncbi:MAG TPA: DUF2934 domain-containing protein [Myxococcaceae bacterium]|nr:DUF2934 domain-containing protein [Myxococcaceae bacterium]
MARNNAKTSTPSEKETAKVPPAQTTKPAANPVVQAAKPVVQAAKPVAQAANPVAQAATPARNTVLTHEQIARRAYEIFMARGGQPGSPEQDWQQAERELRLGRQ